MATPPQIQAFFDQLSQLVDPSSWKLPELQIGEFRELDWIQTTQRLRRQFYKATHSVESDAPEMAQMDHIVADGAEGPLEARVYTPLACGVPPTPAILYYHGGGFVLGDLDGHEMICMRLADASRCRVISIDYRLAPEHKFPAAHNDALATFLWAIERSETLGIDPERIVVGGDSAGGNLAAYIAQECNRQGHPTPAFQLLCYPLVQFVDLATKKLSFQEGFFMSPQIFDFFRDSYLSKGQDPMDKCVSPLFAPEDDFRGLPPAHILTCGWDPLQAEGRAYADKLAMAGVPCTVREYKDQMHGFWNLTAISVAARDAIQDAGIVVGRAMGQVS